MSAGSLLMNLLLALSLASTASSESVIVLGAGAAGVAAALHLWEAGVDILVLEASDDVGGRMKSGQVAGKTIEFGANWVQGDNSSNWLARLVHDFDIKCNDSDWGSQLEYDDRGPTQQFPFAKQAEWQRQSSLLASSISSDDTLRTLAAASMLDWKVNSKYDDALMVSELDYETAAAPSQVSFGHTYPISTYEDFGDGECFINDQRGFKQVLKSLIDVSGFGHKIKLNQTVQDIQNNGSSVRIITQDSIYHADRVIVTFSVGVLQHDMVKFTPPLPAWKTEAVKKYGMETYLKVFFAFPSKFWPDSEFYLYAGAMRGQYPIWQNMNYKKQWGDQAPYVLMVTVFNDFARKVERQSKEETVAEAMQVLHFMFPNQSLPQPTEVVLHSWSSDPLTRGSYSFWPVGFTQADKEKLCAPVGPIWFAGEACHERYSPFVHGAMMSGNDTATKMLQQQAMNSSRKLTETDTAITTPGNTALSGRDISTTATVAAATLAVLGFVTVAREVFFCSGRETKGTSKSWLLQLACAWNALLDSVEYSFLIPVSYGLAEAASGNASLSGFFIGASGIGYLVGILTGRLMWQLVSRKNVRRVIIACPLLSAMTYVTFCFQLLGRETPDSGLVGLILGVRLAAGFLQGLNQLVENMVKEATPAHQQVRLAMMDYAAICLGIGVGPLFSSGVNAALGMVHELSTDKAAAPSLALGLLSVINAGVLSCTLPSKVPQQTEEECINQGQRKRTVAACTCVLLLATAIAASIEVATSLILELEGNWLSSEVGLATGTVISLAAVVAVAFIILREFGIISDAKMVLTMLTVASFGAVAIFHVFTKYLWQVLVADCLIYPCVVVLASIAEGVLFMTASSDGLLSTANLLILSYATDATAKAGFAPLARYLVEVGGRTAYACMVALGLAGIAGAFVIIARASPLHLLTEAEVECKARRCEEGMFGDAEDHFVEAKYPVILGHSPHQKEERKSEASHMPHALALSLYDEEYIMVLDAEVPDVLCIKETPYGLGLFTNADIPAGQMISRERFHFLPDKPGKILLRTNRGDYTLTVAMHFPLVAPGIREANYYDCFTNHSCEPNIFYDDITYTDANNGMYSTYARKDIKAGSQLVCDYDMFDWDCLDKSVSNCMCGSLSCRCRIHGMKYMDVEQALGMLAQAEPHTRDCFLKEHPEVSYGELTLRKDIDVVESTSSFSMAAKRKFALGDELGEFRLLACGGLRYFALGVRSFSEHGRAPPLTCVFNDKASTPLGLALQQGQGTARFLLVAAKDLLEGDALNTYTVALEEAVEEAAADTLLGA